MDQPSPPKKDESDAPVVFFADHKKVYPRVVRGPHRQVKWLVLATVLTLYYALPLVRWNRGPGMADQAVLLDLYNRRFFIFDIEIWPQQIYYVTFILIFSAVALFMTTAMFGRIWCGFACPQTLWTDLYMLVERWIEGDRIERMRRDQGASNNRQDHAQVGQACDLAHHRTFDWRLVHSLFL